MAETNPQRSASNEPVADRAADPRFALANERTLLAWNRTALALIAGCLAVSQLVKRGSSSVTLTAALALIVFGPVTSLAGYEHWRRNERAIRHGKPVDSVRLTRFLTGEVAAFAVTAVALAVIRLMP